MVYWMAMKEINGKRPSRLTGSVHVPRVSYRSNHLQLAPQSATAYDSMLRHFEANGLRVADVQRLTPGPGVARSAAIPAVTAELPRDSRRGYLALLIHPHGGVTLHAPSSRRGGSRKIRFEIELAAAGAIGKRTAGRYWTLVLLAAPLVTGTIRHGLRTLARRWEEKRVPHRLYAVSPGAKNPLRPVPALPHHDGKRGLLLIHGLFSSTLTAFGVLFGTEGAGLAGALERGYEGRIVGFDHPSASRTPEENARWLLERLEPGPPCRYDILASSRGGLVARALVELAGKRRGSRRGSRGEFVIDRALLVGTPNAGTPLVPRNAGRTRDAYHRLATWLANTTPLLPDAVLPWFAGSLAQLLKWMASQVTGVLPGVAAIAPDSPFLERLNQPSRLGGTLYYAIGGNYDAPRSLALKLADAGLDLLFDGEENDLAVPTAGCAVADAPLPIERTTLFSPTALSPAHRANINHFDYLRARKSQQQIERFLGIPPERPRMRVPIPVGPARSSGGAIRRSAVIALDERPDFEGTLPRLDIAIIADDTRTASYRAWLKRWRGEIARARITTLPPEPFPLLMAIAGLSRTVRTFKTRGDDTYWHSLIGTERSLRRYLEDAGPELSLTRLADAGAMLYKTLFGGETGTLLKRLRKESYENAPVLVTLTSTSSWLADFPWEMVYDPARKRFLNIGDICFFRGVISTRAAVALPALPLVIRMLIAVAQPRDQAELNARGEIDGLMHALAPLVESRRLYIDVLEHTSKQSLKRTLNKTRYHILHYIGHGDYDDVSDTGALIFEDARSGQSDPVDAAELCRLIASHAPFMRLIVLNGCETADGGRADFNRGVAPALVAAGLPGVIGNRLIVGDRAAVQFSTVFYEELSHRRSLAEAIMAARRQLASSPELEPYEWAVPMVFALDPMARFF